MLQSNETTWSTSSSPAGWAEASVPVLPAPDSVKLEEDGEEDSVPDGTFEATVSVDPEFKVSEFREDSLDSPVETVEDAAGEGEDKVDEEDEEELVDEEEEEEEGAEDEDEDKEDEEEEEEELSEGDDEP